MWVIGHSFRTLCGSVYCQIEHD